ncbi:MAG: hypothetical protein J6V08_04940, partial [Candidatus Methanomethylophilaceae archaeon]|nr:hypothetical protein [Candidatus Methanomethylophilaceae archaeon]
HVVNWTIANVAAGKSDKETLTGKVDLLRRDMRTMERRHEEDVRKLWIRIAVLTVTLSVATGSGRFMDWVNDILEVLGL